MGEELAQYINFNSTQRTKIGFEEYIEKLEKLYSSEKMKAKFDKVKEEDKKCIFYVSAANEEMTKHSPFLEGFKKMKIEVLYMTEAIDEYVFSEMKTYKGYKLVDVSREGVKVPGLNTEDKDETEKEKEEKKKKKLEENKEFFMQIKNVLGRQIEKVEIAENLTDSAFSVSASGYGWSANLERIMKAQALKDNTMASFMMGKKILNVNVDHPIIMKIKENTLNEENTKLLKVMFWIACLNCGYS